jgi:hypothetical protein
MSRFPIFARLKMSDTLLAETRLSLNRLAREQGVSVTTAWRWCLRGIKGHRIENFSLGGRRYTSREAFARWVAATNGEPAATGQTPRQRERAIDAAERTASELGV